MHGSDGTPDAGSGTARGSPEAPRRLIGPSTDVVIPVPVETPGLDGYLRQQLRLDPQSELPPELASLNDAMIARRWRVRANERQRDGSRYLFWFLPSKVAVAYMADLDETMEMTMLIFGEEEARNIRLKNTATMIVNYYLGRLAEALKHIASAMPRISRD